METLTVRDALTAIAVGGTPAKVRDFLAENPPEAVRRRFHDLDPERVAALEDEARRLSDRGVEVMSFLDEDYPVGLIQRGRPVAPLLFYIGRRSLFQAPGVGMCGSRKVSPLGLKAAHACGDEVQRRGMAVVSGYAAGVDTATHLAALRGGGDTVVVLAEGIDHFKIKRDFASDYDPSRVLVVSQFPPSQPWAAHAAMARNKVIFGLGLALVVVEAGERGGTLAAGEGALGVGKAVFVLNFGAETPGGNALLLSKGGKPIRSRDELGEALTELNTPRASGESQAALDLWGPNASGQ